MPATERKIMELEAEANAFAQNIADGVTNLQTIDEAISEANAELETKHAAFVAAVSNERFTANNKLVYTNDDQRKSAVIALETSDADYNAFRGARVNLAASHAQQKAAIEQNRNLHKAKLLVLQYYANLP